MNNIYYKAVRYDYGSFRDPDFKYGPTGTVVNHPHPTWDSEDPADYLSVSIDPADCTSFEWRVDGMDSQLLIVEPVGMVWIPRRYAFPNKRAVTALSVVGELPIAHAFGPNGAAVVAYLESLSTVTHDQWDAAYVAARQLALDTSLAVARFVALDEARKTSRVAARIAAWNAAWNAAMDATRGLARDAARNAAGDAAEALVVRDMIMPKQFDILVEPMRAAGVEFPMRAVGGDNE